MCFNETYIQNDFTETVIQLGIHQAEIRFELTAVKSADATETENELRDQASQLNT